MALTFVQDFKYPGHTEFRMHAPPSRTGAALWGDLRRAVTEHRRAELIEDASVTGLIADDGGAARGVVVERAGRVERVGARQVILAANGFAANREMLARYCPEVAGAYYFGGEGNTGEAIRWGQALGGAVAFMDAHQAHASVAVPHGILITYALVTEGGIQVNRAGRRFGDETTGYSEHALRLLAALGLPAQALDDTLDQYRAVAEGRRADAFGRRDCRRLEPPFHGVKVTGALFHTQGGLVVDAAARVLRTDGSPVANLYAGGGTAAGLSGHGPGGYFSGNGLLTALGYGMLAGRDAARAIRQAGREEWRPGEAGPAGRQEGT